VSVCASRPSFQGNGLGKCVPSFGGRHRLGKHVPEATITGHSRRIIGPVIFCAVRVLSKENLWVCLCIFPSLLVNNLVKTFPRQRRIVAGVVFYVVHIVLKGSRRLVLSRTSFFFSLPSRIEQFLYAFTPIRYYCRGNAVA
jgi:hypothetical protein